ncbi:MAG: polysaccharide biosynthesis/export family protein [Planctomycetota bacterium]
MLSLVLTRLMSAIVRCRLSALASLITVALVAGCADTRVSFAEFQEMERESLAVEPVSVDPRMLALTDLRPYTVGPGDVLNLSLLGLSQPYTETAVRARVHDNGQIILPLAGPLEVAGLDLAAVERRIYETYVPAYVKDLTVFVELTGPETTTVVVVGATGQPGLVPLRRNERNVLYAVARAGGFGPAGSGRVHVRPVDPEQPETTYDLTDVNDVRLALTAAPLRSGDMVSIEPAETSAVYTTGLLNAPGPIAVPKDGKLPLSRAIAAAGGLPDFLDPQEATLWRRLPDGRQVRTKVAIADVMAGRAPDFDLLPGDLLDVPHTLDTRFRQWAAQNIRIGPFGVTAVYDPVSDYRARILRGNNDSGTWRRSLLNTLGTGIPELLVPPVPTPTPTAP